MTLRIDYQAVNAVGRVLATFGDEDLARRWVREHAPVHEDLHVAQVTTTIVSRRIYTPRVNRLRMAA